MTRGDAREKSGFLNGRGSAFRAGGESVETIWRSLSQMRRSDGENSI